MKPILKSLLLSVLLLYPFSAMGQPAETLEKKPDGVLLKLADGFLNLQFVSESIVRVAFSKNRKFFVHPSLSVLPGFQTKPNWNLIIKGETAALLTSALTVSVNRTTAKVQFFDPKGKEILSEIQRDMKQAKVQGVKTFHVRQQWEGNPAESLYGLGQNQYGLLDLKDYDLNLWQHNTNVVVPFLVSSEGYGILWDNPSFTRFGDLREFTPIPAENLLDKNKQPGGLSVGPLDQSGPSSQTAFLDVNLHPQRGEPRPLSTRWEGFLSVPTEGDYQFQCRSNGGIKVWMDGALLMSHWRQGWLTDNDQIKVHLAAKQPHSLKIEWDTEQGTTFKFLWKTPSSETKTTSLWSEVADGIDYYFVYGPGLDEVIAGYRALTGQAPLMPSWAFGLWQSRQRYEAQAESLKVVEGFREKKIPFDNIVQDWRYWPDGAWGSHQFDPNRFPDPEGWLKKLHEMNAHVMISVWGKFYPGSPNFAAMKSRGYLYDSILKEGVKDWLGYPYSFYDAFNPGARKLFWAQMNGQIFQKGIDAWWMDSTEPDLMPSPPDREIVASHMNPTALGPGSRVLNAYPLMNSLGIYEGQRKTSPNQRVFILTRSGFAGSQRTASAIWSGDVTSDWSVFAKQIPAGLNMSLSGIPYWTTDIGGYTMRRKFAADHPKPEDEEEWRELNTRWFQFGTFCPLLRAHGESRKREMWEFGGGDSPAYKAMLKFDRLRYRLFPYLYSMAGNITHKGGTMMRPLVMDFPHDPGVRGLTDEYLFGKAFLVAPVTEYKSRNRKVYLPESASWYDFWTGKLAAGKIQAEAPYDSMPLFVRAGSILPFGSELQYVSEKPQDPITLYVYTGTDGDFTLYEDDGLTYDYEKGEYSEIPFHWNDNLKTLTLGERKGSFKGMMDKRTFEVVLVSRRNKVGFSFNPKSVGALKYEGKAVSFPPR